MVNALNHQALISHVKKQCLMDATGHDWQHVERVYKMALILAAEENADQNTVGLGALMHDLWDHKLGFSLEDQRAGVFSALDQYGPDLLATQKEDILLMIESVSFKGGSNPIMPTTIEAKVLQDADRLDALGAIGIARTFAYGGAKGRPLGTSIEHFHEKLLKLKDLMHTDSAKRLAGERHRFLELFLEHYVKDTR